MADKQGTGRDVLARTMGGAALILAVILVFVPLGGYLTPLVGLLALLAGSGGAVWGLVGVVLSFANLLLLSPVLYLAAKSGFYAGEWKPVVVWLGLMGWQVLAGGVVGFFGRQVRS